MIHYVPLFSVALEGDKGPGHCLQLAKGAETLGFSSLHIYEHLPYRPAWPLAFLLARATERIKIGPVTIPAPLYPPLQLARYLALMNELAPGRALLGISRGGYLELLGLNRPPRRAVLDLLKQLEGLIKGEVKEGGLEIYVGTSGPLLAKEVCQFNLVKGVVVDNLWSPNYAKYLRLSILKGLSEANRPSGDVRLIARPFTYVLEEREEGRKGKERLVQLLAQYLPHLVGDSPMLRAAGTSLDEVLKDPKGCSKKLLESFVAFGTPKDLVEGCRSLIRAGVEEICFGHPWGRRPHEALRLLAEEVVPKV